MSMTLMTSVHLTYTYFAFVNGMSKFPKQAKLFPPSKTRSQLPRAVEQLPLAKFHVVPAIAFRNQVQFNVFKESSYGNIYFVSVIYIFFFFWFSIIIVSYRPTKL